MSSNRKRSYGGPAGPNKSTRLVGGRVLSYKASMPLAGSFRSRQVPPGMVAAVRRAGEKKGMDTPIGQSNVIATTNTNGSSFVLNLVQQGAGSWNRIGRKINLESVRLRGVVTIKFFPQATTGDVFANTLRMVVVWDKQPSGAAIPTFDSIFGRTVQDGTESTSYLDPIKYDNMDRFSVLRDLVITGESCAMKDTGTTTNSQKNIAFDEYIKLGGREVVFLGQTNPMTIADISTGALYVYFRTETDVSTLTQVDVDSTAFARLRYSDL